MALKTLVIEPDYFHISFDKKLEGVWKPMLPAGSSSKKTDMSEPDYPRISVAPSIEQCFWAVYPNISQYFEKDNYPYLEFMVYVPVITNETKVMSNADVVRDHLVHDAHVTGEAFILSNVLMKKDKIIRIKNCTKNKEIWYYPFNDKKREKRFLSHEIEYSVVKSF
jgi:hypothetical protein